MILIIGILAAAAIPMFLSQTAKANDSNVEAAIGTAQTAEKAYLTDNGHYATTSGTSGNPLTAIEPTLTHAFADTGASPAGFGMSTNGNSDTDFTISATDPVDNITYTLHDSNAVVTRTCKLANGDSAASQGACDANGHWGS